MKIGDSIGSYGGYLKNLGMKHTNYVYAITRFAKYVGPQTKLNDISEEQCVEYMYRISSKDGKVTSYWFRIYSILKGLFEWARHKGYMQHNPLPIDRPNNPKAFIPYIYSNDELLKIFNGALICKSQPFTMYNEVLQVILKTTYFLGLRPNETLRLCIHDIVFGNDNYVIVKETKYYKSRIVPFNIQVSEMLKVYLQWRLVHNFPSNPESPLFFTKKLIPVPLYAVRISFKEICTTAEICRDKSCRFGPRIYDLRHTFATNRVICWYRDGSDAQDLLPLLSTYMGHAKLQSTASYIHFTDELLFAASNKFKLYINKL